MDRNVIKIFGMSQPSPILDYAPPPPRVPWIVRRMWDLTADVRWFFFKRKAGWTDATFTFWSFAVFWNVEPAIQAWAQNYLYEGPRGDFLALLGYLSIICLCVTLILRRGRRPWLRRFIILIVWFAIGIASGLFQLETCCHTTWLQIAGGSIPLDGRGCGNAQPTAPWWMRKPR